MTVRRTKRFQRAEGNGGDDTVRILQENLEETLKPLTDVDDVSAPEFENSWEDYSPSNYVTAGYWKDAYGLVHLQGLVKGGTPSGTSTIFTLPEQYRPQDRLLFVVDSGGAHGRCDVLRNGNVIAMVGLTTWFSLSGIYFRAEQ